MKQLSLVELHKCIQKVDQWLDRLDDGKNEGAKFLKRIEDNSRLPTKTQRCLERLRRKQQAENLSESEADELKVLWQCVDRMDIARIEALAMLSQIRGTDLIPLMQELGVEENDVVF